MKNALRILFLALAVTLALTVLTACSNSLVDSGNMPEVEQLGASYTVSFLDWDGTLLKEESVREGRAAYAPAASQVTVPDGYKLVGWDTDFSHVSGAITVRPVYEQFVFHVTFCARDGSVIEVRSIDTDKKETLTAPEYPEVTGYHFVGWTDGETLLDPSTVKADITLTAAYEINSYTVTFVDAAGTSEQTVTHGSAAATPTPAVPAGQRFDKWDADFSEVTGDMTVTARYINIYAVKFFDWDGTQIGETQIIDEGEAAQAPADPARTGYTFDAWDVAFGAIFADTDVTARYNINHYTVIFKDADGTQLAQKDVTWGSAAETDAPAAPAGKLFDKWLDETGAAASLSFIDADRIFTAAYVNGVTVTFNDKDGQKIADFFIPEGSTAEGPAAPAVAGYRFGGWDKSLENVSADTTFTAQYVKVWTVRFYSWDDTQIGEAQTIDDGTAAQAPEDPAKEGHHFTAWNAAFDNVKSDLDIKAQFAINTYVVKFVDAKGNQIATQTVDWNTDAAFPAATSTDYYTAAADEYAKIFAVRADQTVTLGKVAKTIYPVLDPAWYDCQLNTGSPELAKRGIVYTGCSNLHMSNSGAYATVTLNVAQIRCNFWINAGVTVHMEFYLDGHLFYVYEETNTTEKGAGSGWIILPAIPAGVHELKITGSGQITGFRIAEYMPEVTVDKENGTTPGSSRINSYATTTVPASAEKEDYTFAGWTTNLPAYKGIYTADEIAAIPFHEDVTIIATYVPAFTPISTQAELAALASKTSGKYGIVADMTLSAWTPINISGITFIGDGHTISGLNYTGAAKQAGLFANATDCTIKGLKVEGSINVNDNTFLNEVTAYGGIVGAAKGTAFIDCVNYVDISAARKCGSDRYVQCGGIAGSAENGTTFTRCTNYGTIYAYNIQNSGRSNAMAGGIVGRMYAATERAEGCENYGDISARLTNGSAFIYVGGIVGETFGNVTGCTNRGAISCYDANGGNFAGGIVGIFQATVNRCVNYGSVYSNNSAGGIVGYTATPNTAAPTVSDCVNRGTVTGAKYAAGIWGQAAHNSSKLDTNIYNCQNDGTVIGYQYVAGIMNVSMSNANLYVYNSMNRGNLIADGTGTAVYVGGLVTVPTKNPNKTNLYNCLAAGMIVNRNAVATTVQIGKVAVNGATNNKTDPSAYVDFAAMAAFPVFYNSANTATAISEADYAAGNAVATMNAYVTKQNGTESPAWIALAYRADGDRMALTYAFALDAQTMHKVTYISQGAVVASVCFADGETAFPLNLTRTGYHIVSWKAGDAAFDFATPVTADITLTVEWAINIYTVTFDTDGGSEIAAQTMEHGSAAVKPADPTKDNCRFEGWFVGDDAYDFATPVTADVTVTAKWTRLWTVTFDVDGGTPAPQTQIVDDGRTATEPAAPAKAGYRFDGWTVNGEAYDFATAVAADVTVAAKWVKQYTVSFYREDGTTLFDTVNVDENTAVTFPETVPTETDKVFGGWVNMDGTAYDAATLITADKSLKAYYSADARAVTFYDEDGTTVLGTCYLNVGETAEAPAGASKEGYHVKEWQLDGVAFDLATPITENIDLVVVWELDSYTVSFDAAGGSTVASQTVVRGGKATKPTDPTKTGMKFDGWYLDTALFSFDTPITGDTVLTAHWKEDAFETRVASVWSTVNWNDAFSKNFVAYAENVDVLFVAGLNKGKLIVPSTASDKWGVIQEEAARGSSGGTSLGIMYSTERFTADSGFLTIINATTTKTMNGTLVVSPCGTDTQAIAIRLTEKATGKKVVYVGIYLGGNTKTDANSQKTNLGNIMKALTAQYPDEDTFVISSMYTKEGGTGLKDVISGTDATAFVEGFDLTALTETGFTTPAMAVYSSVYLKGADSKASATATVLTGRDDQVGVYEDFAIIVK